MKTAIVVALAILLAGCAAQQPYSLSTQYLASDFQPWTSAGSANLHGQAFMKTVGGDVKTCAGATVDLLPATTYNLEVVNALRTGHEQFANRSGEPDKFIKTAVCDAQGNFRFSGLADRSWIVWTNVTWGIPTGSVLFPVNQQGGRLIRQVDLKTGENEAILTDADFVP